VNLGEKHCRPLPLNIPHPTLELLAWAGFLAPWASKNPWPASGLTKLEFVTLFKTRSTPWGGGTITPGVLKFKTADTTSQAPNTINFSKERIKRSRKWETRSFGNMRALITLPN
jgi:hypothetical protein